MPPKREEVLAQIDELGKITKAYTKAQDIIRGVFDIDPGEVSRLITSTERGMKRVQRKQDELVKTLRAMEKEALRNAGNPEGDQYKFKEADAGFRGKKTALH